MLEFNHMSLECILSAEKTYSTAHKPASCRSQPVLALQAPESTKLKLHGALTGTMVLQKRREIYLPHTHTLVYQSCPGLFLPQLPFDVFHAYTLFGAKVFEPRHSVVIFVLEETAVEFLQRMTYPMGHACCRLHSLLDPPKKYNMCIYPQNDQIILKPVLQTSHSFFKRFDSRHGCNASFNHQDTC